MTEDVLQYIWQTQSFDKNHLLTTSGEEVKVYDPGTLNSGSGPDFAQARLELADMVWSGDIEIHTYASHWDQHQHNRDRNYDKVILHVVWQEDGAITRSDGTSIPTLELRDRLDPNWLERYQHLLHSIKLIPCESYLKTVDNLIIKDTIHTALIERLELKSTELLKTLKDNRGDWQKTAIVWLFAGFGFKKNKEAFQQLSELIDPRIINKLTNQRQFEAYLFGLAGLIPAQINNQYVNELKDEFAWLGKKYALQNREMSATWWKFMRMRPANFPTLRLAQLADFLFKHKSLLRVVLELEVSELKNLFRIKHNDFWQQHYHFTSKTAKRLTGMGAESQQTLLINVVAVLLVAYGKYLNQAVYIAKAVQLLEEIKPESNKIIRYWRSFEIEPATAAESQGLLGLFNEYCKKSRCLSCNVGKSIINVP